MRDEPNYATMTGQYHQNYDAANYERGLVARVMRRGHQILDRTASYDASSTIIEVGAGSGAHLSHVGRPFSRYLLTDESDGMLAQARAKHATRERVEFATENAAKLSVPDGSFDRLIATHVLEHLPNPHEVLREWSRVVRQGGTISLILPSDPGLAWRLGRHFGPRARGEQAGIPYDYLMAREHINSIFNLCALLRYYFSNMKAIWWPMRVPSADLNLLFITHIYV